MIIDGRIKVKNDSELERITEGGILFKDGSHVEADVIFLATGLASPAPSMRMFGLMARFSYGSLRDQICDLLVPEIAVKIKPVWGLDGECELNSVWRDCGVENLWVTLGTHPSNSMSTMLTNPLLGSIAAARLQSIPLALRESRKWIGL